MNIRVFLYITLCRLLNSHGRFGEAYCLRFQGQAFKRFGEAYCLRFQGQAFKMEAAHLLLLTVSPKPIQCELFEQNEHK